MQDGREDMYLSPVCAPHPAQHLTVHRDAAYPGGLAATEPARPRGIRHQTDTPLGASAPRFSGTGPGAVRSPVRGMPTQTRTAGCVQPFPAPRQNALTLGVWQHNGSAEGGAFWRPPGQLESSPATGVPHVHKWALRRLGNPKTLTVTVREAEEEVCAQTSG